MESPLEAAVRAHFKHQIEPTIGQSRHTTPDIAPHLIERKTQDALTILRERLAEDALPTEDDVHRATLEASHRTIEGLIPQMRNPKTQDPLRREILSALADSAEKNMAKRRAFGPYPTEEQRAELTRESIESFQAVTERIEASGPKDAGGAPTPQ